MSDEFCNIDINFIVKQHSLNIAEVGSVVLVLNNCFISQRYQDSLENVHFHIIQYVVEAINDS